MKKTIFLIFGVLILINLVLADTLSKGGQIEIGGKKLTVKGISKDSAVIDVDGVSNIVRLNEPKIINGVKVSVGSIFYAGSEGSQVDVTAESLYVCGNGNCDETETTENCCKDCGCKNGLECDDNRCREKPVNKCNNDIECDDKDPSTEDVCTSSPKECKHMGGKLCEKNDDCDDGNECTKDECKSFDCFNTKIEGCSSNNTIQNDTKKNESKLNNITDVKKDVEKFIAERESLIEKIISFFKRLFLRGGSD